MVIVGTQGKLSKSEVGCVVCCVVIDDTFDGVRCNLAAGGRYLITYPRYLKADT